MTIQTIIKKAVKRLELEGKLLTPDYYAEAFCKEATLAKMNVEDCSHVEKFAQTLNPEFKKELKQYRIKSMAEFTRFLVSRLNRTNQSVCSESLAAQTIFTKRVLQVVEVLHNKEAADLARLSSTMLSDNPNIAIIEQFRQYWINFITTYDDSFLNSIGIKDNKDLKKSIEKLDLSPLSSSGESADLSKISSLLVASFVPSIASSVNDKIANISQRIKQNPELISSVGMADDIKPVI